MFEGIYQNQSVFITGHTGFKGSWLSLWLKKLGAKVFGYSLPPPTIPNHWKDLSLEIQEFQGDICDKTLLVKSLKESKPAILFHFAAQALVGRSYKEPLATWSTNVMGTTTVLDACREIKSLKAIVVVTTDKVYHDQKWDWGYREIDPLGGHDPYSASKAACELLINSYRNAFFSHTNCLIASARAGNVIGGGDWAKDRLIPDLMRAVKSNTILKVRALKSMRPWQHVLDCLYGYLILGQRLLQGDSKCAAAWNFGPSSSDCATVGEILQYLQDNWAEIDWMEDSSSSYHETRMLSLDSTKARNALGWKPVWSLEKALNKTTEWYVSWIKEKKVISSTQLQEYMRDASLYENAHDLLQLTY